MKRIINLYPEDLRTGDRAYFRNVPCEVVSVVPECYAPTITFPGGDGRVTVSFREPGGFITEVTYPLRAMTFEVNVYDLREMVQLAQAHEDYQNHMLDVFEQME